MKNAECEMKNEGRRRGGTTDNFSFFILHFALA